MLRCQSNDVRFEHQTLISFTAGQEALPREDQSSFCLGGVGLDLSSLFPLSCPHPAHGATLSPLIREKALQDLQQERAGGAACGVKDNVRRKKNTPPLGVQQSWVGLISPASWLCDCGKSPL